jgi:FAD/FMN-containing dehydrogenase
MKPGQLYVNFGFWDSVPAKPNWPAGYLNRKIELMVEKLKGKKSLYSDSFYSKDEFNKLYNGKEYAILKSKYDPKNKFKDLYDKTVNKE